MAAEVFLQELCGWHFFFFSGLKIRFPKIQMHLMDCYIVNTFHLPGHPHGMEEVYLVVIPNPRSFRRLTWASWKTWTAKPPCSVPSCFLSMLVKNKGSGTRQPCSDPSFGTSKLCDLEESLKLSKPVSSSYNRKSSTSVSRKWYLPPGVLWTVNELLSAKHLAQSLALGKQWRVFGRVV